MKEEKPQYLFGLPVVVSTSVPSEGEIIFGTFPTWEEVLEHGSFEKAIEAQKGRLMKLKGLKYSEMDEPR